jgi:ubiquinone/menaquinone biosynthesis C-methylase UbiE
MERKKEDKAVNTSEIQRLHFNKISARYNSGRSHENHLTYKQTLWNYVFAKLDNIFPARPNQGLEAMAGNCEISLKFLEKYPDLRMHAFDFSDNMVLAARKQTEGKKIEVFHSDILQFKDRDNKYDFVVLIGGLHHVPDSVALALKNIHSCLRPGGLFVNFEPTHNNFLLRKIRERIYRKNDLFEENSERGFNLRDYNDLLNGAGLKPRIQFYPGLIGYVLYYNPDAFPMLNIGPKLFSKLLCRLDLLFGNTFLGRYFSFATFTIAQKV